MSNNFEFNKYGQSINNDDIKLAELNDYRKVLDLQWQLRSHETLKSSHLKNVFFSVAYY